MDITDPEILRTEKFGSREHTDEKSKNYRKLKVINGRWTVVCKGKQKKERNGNDKKRTYAALLFKP